jgi:hypothetical protein
MLMAGLVVVYQANGRFIGGSDAYCTRFMAVNLARDGSYYFDASKPYAMGVVVDDPASPSFGRMINQYNDFVPTLLAPFYVPFYRWAKLPPEHFLTFYLDKLFASLWVAAGAAATLALARRLHGGRWTMALTATLAVALGTSLWAIASQASWAHGPSFCMTMVACLGVVKALETPMTGGRRSDAAWAALAGFCASGAVATRPTDALFAVPFMALALWELRRPWRRWAGLVAGATAPAAWFAWHNWLLFGSPFRTGFQWNITYRRVPHILSLDNFWGGLAGLLASPSMGLFATAPVMLFAVPGLVGLWRRWRPRTLAMIARDCGGGRGSGRAWRDGRRAALALMRLTRLGAAFVVAHVAFYSCYREWWGGWSYAHRYLIDVMGFAALAMAWFLRPGARARSLRWPLLIPAFLFSVAFQFYGAFFWSGQAHFKLLAPPRRPWTPTRLSNLGDYVRFSPFFSLEADHHLILAEPPLFNWRWTSWDAFARPLATPAKIDKDLFVTRTVNFRPAQPIILDYGR